MESWSVTVCCSSLSAGVVHAEAFFESTGCREKRSHSPSGEDLGEKTQEVS